MLLVVIHGAPDRHAGLDIEMSRQMQVFTSPAEHYRCRCEFTIWHDADGTHYVMFEKVSGEKHPKRVKLQQYPVANKLINSMMPVVLQALATSDLLRRKLFSVNFHTTLSGHALVTLVYHKKLLDVQSEWTKAAQQLRYKQPCGPSSTVFARKRAEETT
jgi:tRNA (uracil-5-)-methyltransferase